MNIRCSVLMATCVLMSLMQLNAQTCPTPAPTTWGTSGNCLPATPSEYIGASNWSTLNFGTDGKARMKLGPWGQMFIGDVDSFLAYTGDVRLGVYGNIFASGFRIGFGAPQPGFPFAVNTQFRIGMIGGVSEVQGYLELKQAANGTGDLLTYGTNGRISRRTNAEALADMKGWSHDGNAVAAGSFLGTTSSQPLIFKANSIEGFRVNTDGTLSVGTTSKATGFQVSVGGGVMATRVKVQLQSGWADYVFAPDYALPTLEEVSAFVRSHRHLPGVPSAAEVERDGLDLGNNQAILLKKIEELTLYMIDMDKKFKKLEQENQELKKKIEDR